MQIDNNNDDEDESSMLMSPINKSKFENRTADPVYNNSNLQTNKIKASKVLSDKDMKIMEEFSHSSFTVKNIPTRTLKL